MNALSVVEQYYTHFNNQNWEGMLSLLDQNVKHEINQGGVEIGLDAFRKFMQHMDECYSERLEDMVFMANTEGSRVACEFTVHGVYKKADAGLPPAHGQKYVLPAGAFLEVKNGKIVRVTTYYNLNDWIKMVG